MRVEPSLHHLCFGAVIWVWACFFVSIVLECKYCFCRLNSPTICSKATRRLINKNPIHEHIYSFWMGRKWATWSLSLRYLFALRKMIEIPTASPTTRMQDTEVIVWQKHKLQNFFVPRWVMHSFLRAVIFRIHRMHQIQLRCAVESSFEGSVVWMSPRSSQVKADREQCERDPRSCGKCTATPWQTLVQQKTTKCFFYAGFQFGKSSKKKKHSWGGQLLGGRGAICQLPLLCL